MLEKLIVHASHRYPRAVMVDIDKLGLWIRGMVRRGFERILSGAALEIEPGCKVRADYYKNERGLIVLVVTDAKYFSHIMLAN